jgi:hypothetical protein
VILRTATPRLLALLATASCNWLSLAKNALSYRELARGAAGNLAATDSVIYATLAEDGLAVMDGRSGQVLATLLPPRPSESVDDLALADDLLFVLDARAPGHLSAYSLRDPLRPRLVSPPREVPVGPFSGVSAHASLCIVSGGTSALTAWRYDSGGLSAHPPATADLGRGQPDVMLGPDGRVAYVSTHYWGPYFGLDVVRYDSASSRLNLLAKLALDGAGFTTGGAKPANFPIEAASLSFDTVLVAHARGLAVIDVHEPGRPRLLETIDVGGPAVNVDALDAFALVAVSGPAPALVLLTFAGGRTTVARRIALASGTFPAGVALTATHAAVALGDRGVQVFQR